MKRYLTNDGEEILADSSADVLEALRKLSLTQEDSLEHFKEALIDRTEQQTGFDIADDSDDGVVEALLKNGLLIEGEG